MMLYVRFMVRKLKTLGTAGSCSSSVTESTFAHAQVEEYAFTKWGGPEALDAEWDKRTNQKKEKKDKQFKEKLKGKACRQVALRCISVLR